jgi:hypothetical protein
MKKRMLLVLACAITTGAAAAEIRGPVGADGRVGMANMPYKTAALTARGPAMRRNGADNAGLDLLRPEVIGAVANVMGIAHLVSSSRTFCVATSPTSYKKYSSVADAWHLRNASVISQKEKVMSTGDQRLVADALSGDMVRKTEEMMRSVRGAGTAEKIAWCDKAFADVGRGDLDLVGRASIAPLMSYHPR